jgi:hypothetical protein
LRVYNDEKLSPPSIGETEGVLLDGYYLSLCRITLDVLFKKLILDAVNKGLVRSLDNIF